MMKCAPVVTVLLLFALAMGEETRAPDPSTADRDAHRAAMKRVARSLELTVPRGGEPLTVRGEPLLRYTDATRKQGDGALWIWGEKGRPSAVLATEYYQNPPRGPRWMYEIASLSGQRITVRDQDQVNWTAEKPGLDLKDLPEGGTPADQPARRLSQMRQLLRRFSVRETAVVDGPIELRPMTNPLYRYEDAKAGLIDGAIFAFVNGTNPEVFVLLEAHSKSDSERIWKYALAQMTGAEVSVGLEGKEIWTRTEADPPAIRESYVNGWLKSE